MSSKLCSLFLGLALAFAAGCQEKHKEGDGHDHDHDYDHGPQKEEKGHDHEGHKHEEGENAGASFKPDVGLQLSDEVRRLMELQTAESSVRTVTPSVRLNAQVYQQRDKGSLASALVPVATSIPLESAVTLRSVEGKTYAGKITAIHTNSAATLGGAEVLLSLAEPLPVNTQLEGSFTLPSRQTLQVPQSAVLRTAEGTFVYRQNSNAFLRATVQLGESSAGMVEVLGGLSAGAEIVAHPVQTLWLIELRAVKGGGHSH